MAVYKRVAGGQGGHNRPRRRQKPPQAARPAATCFRAYSFGSRRSRSETFTPTSDTPPKAVPVFFLVRFSSACL